MTLHIKKLLVTELLSEVQKLPIGHKHLSKIKVIILKKCLSTAYKLEIKNSKNTLNCQNLIFDIQRTRFEWGLKKERQVDGDFNASLQNLCFYYPKLNGILTFFMLARVCYYYYEVVNGKMHILSCRNFTLLSSSRSHYSIFFYDYSEFC